MALIGSETCREHEKRPERNRQTYFFTNLLQSACATIHEHKLRILALSIHLMWHNCVGAYVWISYANYRLRDNSSTVVT